jgi:hypothetical protein
VPLDQLIKKFHITCRIWIAILFVSFIFPAFSILLYPTPPVKMITQSRIALHRALNVNAHIYAPALYEAAEQNWDSLFREWRCQNYKRFYHRRFRKLEAIAVETNRLAVQSELVSIQNCDSLESLILGEISMLDDRLNTFKEQYRTLPISMDTREQYVKSELMLYQSQFAYQRQDYFMALSRLDKAKNFLGETGEEVANRMGFYFYNMFHWRRWANETVEWSKKNHDVALLVDKLAHTCKIYMDGELLEEYPVELGSNWIGHKTQRGDCRTPEGKYLISKKKSLRKTVYYKALVIDYPNDTDRALFSEAKQKRKIPGNAEIGGAIEIHGEGGQNADWTSGCIALHNTDMDRVFDLAKVGTPVTIVGSLRSLAD